jgi:hypothetical protein
MQLAKNVIKNNIEHFDKNDVILHVTLEDNNIKLSRRIFTIFGDYPPYLIRKLYSTIKRKSQYLKKHQPQSLNTFIKYTENIFNYLEEDSIKSITKNKVFYMVQDQSDSSYTTSNLLNALTILKLKGYRVRAIFLDYVDLMTSTRKFEKEYDEHGQIIKDLRVLAKEYHIPIITATQLKRETESPKVKLSNITMGDSYKKVRYSDYIIMIRQLYEYEQIEFQEEYPIHTIIPPNSNEYNELLKLIIPAEYVFTKVKDTDKNVAASKSSKNYIIFSKFNLNLYDSIDELYNDYLNVKEKGKIISNFISQIENDEFLKNSKENIFSF